MEAKCKRNFFSHLVGALHIYMLYVTKYIFVYHIKNIGIGCFHDDTFDLIEIDDC